MFTVPYFRSHPVLRSTASTLVAFGGVCVGLGVVSTCGLAPLISSGASRGAVGVYTGTLMMVYFGPGVAFLVFSEYVKRARRWAVTASLTVAAVHGMLILMALVGVLKRAS